MWGLKGEGGESYKMCIALEKGVWKEREGERGGGEVEKRGKLAFT